MNLVKKFCSILSSWFHQFITTAWMIFHIRTTVINTSFECNPAVFSKIYITIQDITVVTIVTTRHSYRKLILVRDKWRFERFLSPGIMFFEFFMWNRTSRIHTRYIRPLTYKPEFIKLKNIPPNHTGIIWFISTIMVQPYNICRLQTYRALPHPVAKAKTRFQRNFDLVWWYLWLWKLLPPLCHFSYFLKKKVISYAIITWSFKSLDSRLHINFISSLFDRISVNWSHFRRLGLQKIFDLTYDE